MSGFRESPMYEDVPIVNPITSIGQKRCTKCKRIKELSGFNKDNKNKDGLQYRCKACEKQYRDDHKVEIAEYRRIHKEEKATFDKEYRQTNKEEVAEYDKEYRRTHKEEKATHDKKYRQTETGKATNRKSCHKRRALKLGVGYEVFDDKEIYERDGYICQLCGKKTRPDFKNQYHNLYPNIDHIIPLSKNGAHTRQNTQCLCRQCNMIKHNTGVGDQLRMFG